MARLKLNYAVIMKLKVSDLNNLALVDAKEEKLGKLKDILFDDREWKVRYIVVDTGGWLKDQLVLVTPDQVTLTEASVRAKQLHCSLTKETIEAAPPLDVNAPVSRRYEAEMAAYYRSTPYWLGNEVWGTANPAASLPPTPEEQARHEQVMEDIEQCHMRSAEEVSGYEVIASNDVSLGEIEQMEIVWEDRAIVNLAVKEGSLLFKTAERDIPPSRVDGINWQERRVHLNTPYFDDDDLEATSCVPSNLSATS